MHRPQRYLERCLKSFGGGGRNGVPGGSWKGVSDEFDGLTHHIGKACSKTRVFKRLNSSCQGGRSLLVSCCQRFDAFGAQPFGQL